MSKSTIPVYCTVNKLKEYPVRKDIYHTIKNIKPSFQAYNGDEVNCFRRNMRREVEFFCGGRFEHYIIEYPEDSRNFVLFCNTYLPEPDDKKISIKQRKYVFSLLKLLSTASDETWRSLIRFESKEKIQFISNFTCLPELMIEIEDKKRQKDTSYYDALDNTSMMVDLGFNNIRERDEEVKIFLIKMLKCEEIGFLEVSETFVKNENKIRKYIIHVYPVRSREGVIGDLANLTSEPYDSFTVDKF